MRRLRGTDTPTPAGAGFLVLRRLQSSLKGSLADTVSPSVREAVLPSSPVPPGTVKIEEDRRWNSSVATGRQTGISAPCRGFLRCLIFKLKVSNVFTPTKVRADNRLTFLLSRFTEQLRPLWL